MLARHLIAHFLCLATLLLSHLVRAEVPDTRALVGTWRLVSLEDRRSPDDIRYPSGREAVGTMSFDSRGNMALQIMGNGYLAYFGTYRFEGEKSLLTVDVQGSDYRPYLGQRIQRLINVVAGGDELLQSPLDMPTYRGVWRKVK